MRRWWIHLLLLVLTLVTTTAFGYGLVESFDRSRSLDEFFFDGYQRLLFGDHNISQGLIYSVPMLTILMAHEMGHYIACRRWGIAATLPFFLPSPLLLGTFGAFIQIRVPVYNRRSLFDIGVAGPIAGFVVLLPVLVAGVWMSHVAPNAGGFFGTPLLLRVFEAIRFPGVAPENIMLHPVAVSAWAGLLATAVNLLPAGQLDGGHIVYALGGGQYLHRTVSRVTIGVLAVLGFFCSAWWIWAVLLFFFRRHPFIYDETPLGAGRLAIAIVALIILVLSLALAPVNTARLV